MHARVTAVLVSSNGAGHLPRTLEAIAAQTRAPDALVVVDCASTDDTATLLAAAHPTRFISASSRLSFGTGVAHALGVAPPPESENDWIWLLSHDTAPEPGALAALLAAVEVNPSVAAAGPKQMEWADGDYIAEFGETVTSLGASVALVETELDQAQHERMSDVLGMGAAGLLVRHTVWNEVGGFDPALPTADNALDFSIRVRLAGHRVIAVPAARVATDGDGYSGPGRSIKGSARRKRQTARRAAQLHRRLVYAPGIAVLFHWLSLVPLAVLRSVVQLVRKQPGAIGGEFAAAFKAAFGSRIGEARKRLKAARRVGWKAIAPLRMPGEEIRRRRSLQREIALTYLRGDRDRIQFIASGGVATVLVVALVGFVLFLPAFGAAAIVGGGALPLDGTPGALWEQTGVGFRDLGLGFTGAADPFAAVIALLGSLTFWSPSFAIVCLYLVALPLAALAAWFCAARLTERPVVRAAAAVLWVLAPPFLGALDAGMIGAVIAHLLLPWLVLAGLAAPKSWSASAMASILFAAVLAVAPSLWPALIVLWLAATIASRRDVMRLIGVPIPALVLFAPLAIDQFTRGTPLAILADPGSPVWRAPVPVLDLLIGLPQSGLGGWQSIAGGAGIDSSVVLLVLGLLAVPLGLLAIASLFLPGSYRAVAAVLLAVLGFATAVGATQLALATSASEAVTIWPGSGLSLYWMGLVGAAAIGLSALPRLAALPAVIATVAVAVIVLPAGLGVLLGTSEAQPGAGRQLPAYVTAEAQATPRVGTLVLEPQQNGGLGAEIVHGAGPTLSQQSTLASTASAGDGRRGEVAEIVGDVASISGAEVSSQLSSLGVEFVLLTPAGSGPGSDSGSDGAGATDVAARASNALNGNAQFTFIGDTAFGQLWQVAGDDAVAALPAPSPTNTGTPYGVLVLVAQAFVFLIALLLALPAGRLQAQGSRAVSTTAHVAAAHSAEEQLAEEKQSEFDDDIPVGDEPEVLDTEAPAPLERSSFTAARSPLAGLAVDTPLTVVSPIPAPAGASSTPAEAPSAAAAATPVAATPDAPHDGVETPSTDAPSEATSPAPAGATPAGPAPAGPAPADAENAAPAAAGPALSSEEPSSSFSSSSPSAAPLDVNSTPASAEPAADAGLVTEAPTASVTAAGPLPDVPAGIGAASSPAVADDSHVTSDTAPTPVQQAPVADDDDAADGEIAFDPADRVGAADHVALEGAGEPGPDAFERVGAADHIALGGSGDTTDGDHVDHVDHDDRARSIREAEARYYEAATEPDPAPTADDHIVTAGPTPAATGTADDHRTTGTDGPADAVDTAATDRTTETDGPADAVDTAATDHPTVGTDTDGTDTDADDTAGTDHTEEGDTHGR
jgi:GT2 family glycosyltransferase